jgi:hypothetical protein
MVLSKHRDVPIRLKLAVMDGVDPERLARAMPALPYGLAMRTIDAVMDGCVVGYDTLCQLEEALDELEPIRPAAAPNGRANPVGRIRAAGPGRS